MSDSSDISRRDLFQTALGVGGAAVAAGTIAASVPTRDAYAQLLKSGISEDSVLAKMKKTGKLTVGYAQTKPNFYLDPKPNELRGIFHDATQFLGEQTEVEIEYKEVLWGNATIGLRKGDFDLFVSSLTYTVPRALVIAYVGPIHHKGAVSVVHKDNRDRYKTVDDLNSEDVTFVVSLGDASADQIKIRFPKARIMAVQGQLELIVEPVRTGRATAFVTGDFDSDVFVGNADWAHVVDREHPWDLLPNTWACRYGDTEWKFFLDMFCNRMLSTGFMKDRFAAYAQELIGQT